MNNSAHQASLKQQQQQKEGGLEEIDQGCESWEVVSLLVMSKAKFPNVLWPNDSASSQPSTTDPLLYHRPTTKEEIRELTRDGIAGKPLAS